MEIRYFLGNKCNLRCAYCDVNKDRPDPDYHEENLKLLLDTINEQNSKGNTINKVLLIGGEPTLYHDHVLEILDKIHNLTERVVIVTNGTSIDKVKEYIKYDNVHITVSWDGLVNERGFDSEPLIKYLNDNNKLFSVNYVICNSNYDRLCDDFDYVNEHYPLLIEKSLMEPIPCTQYPDYYKVDYDVFYQSLKKLYDKYPRVPMLFKRHKRKGCPLGNPDNIVIKINNGGVFKGCLTRNHLDVIHEDKICKFSDLKTICEKCGNDLCKVCDKMIEDSMIFDQSKIDHYASVGYYDDSFMCKTFKIIQDIVLKSTRKAYFKEKLLNMSRIQLMITTDCNFRCTYCYEHKTCGVVMSENVLDGVVNLFKHYRDAGVEIPEICLFGGEPLMSSTVKPIKYLLNALKKNNLKPEFALVTNGYELNNPEIIDIINEMDTDFGIKNIQVSIDNLGDLNDRTRRTITGERTFDRIISNIKMLSEMIGFRKIGINSVLDYKVIHKTVDWIKYIDRELFNKYIGHVMVSLNQSSQSPLTRSQEIQVDSFYSDVIDAYKSGEISKHMLVTVFNIGEFYCSPMRKSLDTGCGVMNNFLNITPSGEFTPCHYDITRTYGKVMNDDIDVYDNVYDTFDMYGSKGQFRCDGLSCDTCSNYDICKKCKAANVMNNGNVNDCNPTKCMVYQKSFSILQASGIDVNEFKRLDRYQLKDALIDIKDLQILLQSEDVNNLSNEEKMEIVEVMNDLNRKISREKC